MAVKIRLARRGRKKLALYDVVVADARAPRDGRFIEKLGTYNPNSNPADININADRALDWLLKGAQPTDTVRTMLSYRGVLLRKHLQVGVLKGAITQEQADERFAEWLKVKEAKIQTRADQIAHEQADKEKARMDAETKVKEARLVAIQQKRAQAVEQLAAEIRGDESSEATAEVEDTDGAAEEAPSAETAEQPPVDEAKPEKSEPTDEKTPEAPAKDPEEIEAAAQPEASQEETAQEAPAESTEAEVDKQSKASGEVQDTDTPPEAEAEQPVQDVKDEEGIKDASPVAEEAQKEETSTKDSETAPEAKTEDEPQAEVKDETVEDSSEDSDAKDEEETEESAEKQ